MVNKEEVRYYAHPNTLNGYQVIGSYRYEPDKFIVLIDKGVQRNSWQDRYVVATHRNPDSEWASGDYFTSIAAALMAFNARIFRYTQ